MGRQAHDLTAGMKAVHSKGSMWVESTTGPLMECWVEDRDEEEEEREGKRERDTQTEAGYASQITEIREKKER